MRCERAPCGADRSSRGAARYRRTGASLQSDDQPASSHWRRRRNRLRGWTISKPSIKLRKAGDVVAHLAYRSSRVVIFRVRATGGDVVRVRIPIRVVHVGKGRR